LKANHNTVSRGQFQVVSTSRGFDRVNLHCPTTRGRRASFIASAPNDSGADRFFTAGGCDPDARPAAARAAAAARGPTEHGFETSGGRRSTQERGVVECV